MSDDSIHQPHDKLFKEGFGRPANAAAFLREQLPRTVAENIDWEQLALQSGSFIDSQFRQHESDLLFTAPWRDSQCFVYLLFEHQVAEDRQIALRLLRYMVRIWEGFYKSNPPGSLLPVILPVVLAQNDRTWQLTPRFSALFDLPTDSTADLQAFLPDFTFRLIQLASLPFDAIRGTPTGIMVLRVMKAERSQELLSDPVWDEELLAQMPPALVEMLFRYILNADIDSAAFTHRVRTISQAELKTTAMTLAQQLRHEGRQAGRQEDILDALEIRFGQLPYGIDEGIRKIHDETRLRELLRAAIQEPSLDDFLRLL
jgi:predicted transposase/invertase (TIGR01784 family)